MPPFLSYPFIQIQTNCYEHNVSSPYFYPRTHHLSFCQQVLPTGYTHQTSCLVFPAADLFISLNGILYGVHQSYFDQSLLFQEIIHYGEADGIGTDPHYPIPFDTLKKEIFDDLLHLLYFSVKRLEQLSWEN
jgi:hypothetical protein